MDGIQPALQEDVLSLSATLKNGTIGFARRVLGVTRFGLRLLALTVIFIFATNLWVLFRGDTGILKMPPREKFSYAIVLGAGVRGERLSGALLGRMNKAIELYRKGLVDRILVSGDGTDPYYNETDAMERFALRNNIPSEILFTDQQGYSTYASMYRAKEVFDVDTAYVISQTYHLNRAVWIANTLGMHVEGVATDAPSRDWFLHLREIPARTKDFIFVYLNYDPPKERNTAF